MTEILLAAAAAVGWGASDFFGGYSSSQTAVFSVIAITELLGAGLIAPTLIGTHAPHLSGELALAGVAGIAVTVELGVVFHALSAGASYITAPIGAVGAACAVGAGLLGGDPITLWIAAGLLCAVLGGGISASEGSSTGTPRHAVRSVAACLLAAIAIATTQITLHAAARVNPNWATEIEHLTTSALALLIAAATAARARSKTNRDAASRRLPELRQLPMLALVAGTGSGGDLAYAAAHGALSTVSAISSLYPLPTIALSCALRHQRPNRLHATGILVALLGAIILGAKSP